MFSQTVEYALRAMSYLSSRAPESSTTDEIASATQVPAAYLSKVLQALRRADVVRSRRGIGGGIGLTRDATEITILEIVNAVDPIKRITACPIGLAAHATRLCPLHSKLDAAYKMIEDTFRNTTLAEMVREETDAVRRCRFPRVAGS